MLTSNSKMNSKIEYFALDFKHPTFCFFPLVTSIMYQKYSSFPSIFSFHQNEVTYFHSTDLIISNDMENAEDDSTTNYIV